MTEAGSSESSGANTSSGLAEVGWYEDPAGSGLLRRWTGTEWTGELHAAAESPGWYPDPGGGDDLRWWDGVEWHARTAPRLPPLTREMRNEVRRAVAAALVAIACYLLAGTAFLCHPGAMIVAVLSMAGAGLLGLVSAASAMNHGVRGRLKGLALAAAVVCGGLVFGLPGALIGRGDNAGQYCSW